MGGILSLAMSYDLYKKCCNKEAIITLDCNKYQLICEEPEKTLENIMHFFRLRRNLRNAEDLLRKLRKVFFRPRRKVENNSIRFEFIELIR